MEIDVFHSLEKPDLLQIHGESGYQYALKHFDRNVLAKKYLEKLHTSSY